MQPSLPPSPRPQPSPTATCRCGAEVEREALVVVGDALGGFGRRWLERGRVEAKRLAARHGQG